jgi:hypothetical protein
MEWVGWEGCGVCRSGDRLTMRCGQGGVQMYGCVCDAEV